MEDDHCWSKDTDEDEDDDKGSSSFAKSPWETEMDNGGLRIPLGYKKLRDPACEFGREMTLAK